jgi:hypothetical protein
MTRARLGILVIVMMAAWLTYRHWISLETWGWHVRHGQELQVSEYVVPAPKNWHVQNTGEDSWLLTRLDTQDTTGNPARDKKARFHAFVSIFLSRTASTPERLKSWANHVGAGTAENDKPPVVRSFNINGETLTCVGGRRFEKMLKAPEFYESDPAVWECESSWRLNLQALSTDADMPEVWNILSGIRRTK